MYGEKYKVSSVTEYDLSEITDEQKEQLEIVRICERKYPHLIGILNFNLGIPMVTTEIKKPNKRLKKGVQVTVERWDGNGTPQKITVKDVVDDVVIFNEGIAKFGQDLTWTNEKRESEHFREYHCFINWEGYYIK